MTATGFVNTDFAQRQLRSADEFWKSLGISSHATELSIIPPPPELRRAKLIVEPQEITRGGEPLAFLISALDKKLTLRGYGLTDKSIDYWERHPADSTKAVWTSDSLEPDEDKPGVSADEIIARDLPTATLIEALILELDWYTRTGHHTNVKRILYSTGSLNMSAGDGILKTQTFSCDGNDIYINEYPTHYHPQGNRYGARRVYPATIG